MRRDEANSLEDVIRGANPVPCRNDLVDSEESVAVRSLVEQLQQTITATPHDTVPEPTGRPLRWRRVSGWAFAVAFVAILLAVGASALFLRGDTGSVADEPTPSTPATAPDVTVATATDALELVPVVDGWQRIDVAWLERDGVSMAARPNGGFVAVSDVAHPAGSGVMWSPDGLNWIDGDPQRLVPDQKKAVAVVGDHVAILTLSDATNALWIGDPTTGTWDPPLELDTTGLTGELLNIALAAGGDSLLVTTVDGVELPTHMDDPDEIVDVVVWLVDPEERTVARTDLAVESGEGVWSHPVAWFDQAWHVMMPLVAVEYFVVETALWSSPDGLAWTEEQLPLGWRTPILNALTTGPAGAVTCAAIGGDQETAGTWFSPNGADWHLVGSGFSCRGVYSDTFGFVLEGTAGPDPGFTLLSPDGTTLDILESPYPADTVAASGGNLIVHAFRGSEYSAEESAGLEGLWLYHQAVGDPDGTGGRQP